METATQKAREISSIHDRLKNLAAILRCADFSETDKYGNPHLSRFLLENGRLPFITDQVKPWQYRGWLVPYLQMSEAHPLVAPRYSYVLRTLNLGRLLDEPLPQISFVGEFEQSTKAGIKMLNLCLDTVEHSSGSWNGLREFCEWLGFALGVTTEVSKLSGKVQEFLYRTFSLEQLLLHPSDYLGQILCETNHGKRNGFYPTPIHLVDLMTRMVSAGKTGDRRADNTLDPCVGTGRMLMVASNFSMRLYGQDIDPLCCLITKINLALYAPWFYIPDSYFGDQEASAENEIENPLPQAEKPAQESNEAQSDGVQMEETPTLFEQLRQQKELAQKSNRKKQKQYSTEIEQPMLFG